MRETEKHCNTCAHSYLKTENKPLLFGRKRRQHCSSPDYNAEAYTNEMLSEDLKRGEYCRFWTPRTEKGATQ